MLVHFPRKDRWTSQLQCGHMGVVGRRFMGNFLNTLFVTKNCGGLLWAESVLNYSLILTPRLFSAPSGPTAAFGHTNRFFWRWSRLDFWKGRVSRPVFLKEIFPEFCWSWTTLAASSILIVEQQQIAYLCVFTDLFLFFFLLENIFNKIHYI